MKVLEILNAYPGENFLREHARAIACQGDIELSWAFWQTSRVGKMKNVVEGLKESVGLVNTNRSSRFRKLLTRLRHPLSHDAFEADFGRQINKMRPDVIHFQFASLASIHYRRLVNMSRPFTFSVRGSDVQVDPLVLPGYSEKLKNMCDAASGIHTVSESLTDVLVRFGCKKEKITTIRTSISPAWAEIRRTPDPGTLISVGRLHWTKGYPDLILACKHLNDLNIPFRLVIIGEGPQRQQLEFMIRDLSLKDRIVLAGGMSHAEMVNFFERADLFVLSSVLEGFPNTLAEAMMAGVPFVSTEVGGVREILKGEFDNFICPPASPVKLAQTIARYFERREFPSKISQQLAQEHFSCAGHANQFRTFWQRAAGS